MATLSVLSTEYVKYEVTAAVLGIPYQPTSDVVQFAFPATGANPSTWFTGSWEIVGAHYLARILVGPSGGATSLTVGSYDVYIKITDSPETVVRKVGTLTIT